MSLGKLAHGQQAYYVDSVAKGAEEYYTGAKEAPGQWIGSAAGLLGLEGEVDPEALSHLLAHVDPSGQFRLTGAHSVPTVAAFDVTFCAPKSVSLLFALGAPEVSNEVRNAADAAIAASLPVLEAAACRVRRGQGGHTVLDGDGFVAAAFRHRTSRAGDPHLHTHVVVANVAHSPDDGKWSALDGRPLYAWLSPVGHLYEAQLRWELTRRLGVEWGPVRNGIADVAGVDRAVLREFSTRRREIEAHLDELGLDSAKSAQVATYATRQAKDTAVDPAGLLPGWRARAESLGFDADALAATLDRIPAQAPPHPQSTEADALYRALTSPTGLTESRSTFGQREVIKAICNALPAGGRVEDVLALVDGFLSSPHVLAVTAEDHSAVIARNDGRRIAARTDEHRWTTPEMLATEHHLLAQATSRRATATAIAPAAVIEAAITAKATLTDEQAAMVRQICSSGDGVEIVEGVAGAGKTYAIDTARTAWENAGYRVLGCALAARAAKQLQDDAAIPSETIDRLLVGIERHDPTLDDRTVLVVDEAAMVGTRKLTRLLDHAQSVGAKVVLVGDPCQLPEIQAGGAFRGLQGRLGTSLLADNRRQSTPWERAALAQLRDGNHEEAIAAYSRNDRIHQAATGTDLRDALVAGWLQARADGEDALMVAGRRTDVEDLNRRARRALHAAGALGEDRFELGGRPYAVGDEVLARRNDYRLGILNGTRATLEQFDTTRHELTLATSDGTRLVVPFAYAEDGHLTHGYATTIHKAQGATVDRCFVLADDTLDREHAYTALSRGRHGNDLYLAVEDRRVEERHADEHADDTDAALRRSLARTGAQYLAADQVDPPPATLEDLRAARNNLYASIGDGPPDISAAWGRLLDDTRHAEHHRDQAARRLHQAQNDLHALGPIARRVRSTQRRNIDERIDAAARDIAEHSGVLERLAVRRDELTPSHLERQTWEREHRPQLDALAQLDRRIDITQRLDALTRVPEPTIGHGPELSL